MPFSYVVRPRPRDLAEFRPVVRDSFKSSATFMNALVFARFEADRAVVARNLSLFELKGTEEKRRPIRDRHDLTYVIEAEFGVPREITAEALAVLSEFPAEAP